LKGTHMNAEQILSDTRTCGELSCDDCNERFAAAQDKIKTLESQLAECYRLTGADPDGNEDWRLAQHAVSEVRDLRRDHDAYAMQVDNLHDELAELRRGAQFAEPYQRLKAAIDRGMGCAGCDRCLEDIEAEIAELRRDAERWRALIAAEIATAKIPSAEELQSLVIDPPAEWLAEDDFGPTTAAIVCGKGER
jgi:hypothetical protein